MLVFQPKPVFKKGVKIILRERDAHGVRGAGLSTVCSQEFYNCFFLYIETHREFVALVASAICLSTVFIATAIATMAGVKAEGRQAGEGLDGNGARGGGGGARGIDTHMGSIHTYVDTCIVMQGRFPMIWALVVLNLFFILGAAAVLLLQVESKREKVHTLNPEP